MNAPIRVSYLGSDVVVDAPSRLANLISTIPQLRAVDGVWRAPRSPAVLFAIGVELSGLPGFAATPDVTGDLEGIQAWRMHVEQLKRGDTGVSNYDDRLYGYQNLGVHLLQCGSFLLGDEMGTGKTVMALTAARHLYKHGKISHVLVVAPNSMKHRWAEEAATWFPEADTLVIEGTKAKREKAWNEFVDERPRHQPMVVCVNWESLRVLSRVAGYGSIKLTEADREEGILNEVEWDVVIADEAHRAKDAKAKQTRALWAVAERTGWRWGLTGTPVLNTPGDLWAIGRFYDPKTYGSSRIKWHSRYVESIDTPWGPKDLGLKRNREREFQAWFDMSWLRRTKDEVLDLPDITYQTRRLEMGSKQGAAYRRMRDEMIAQVDSGILVATDPLALLTRLSQLASALPVLDDEGGVAELAKPSNKLDALKEILAEIGDRQLVVFAQSRKLIDLVAADLEDYIRITGAETAAQRALGVNRFQDGGAQVALCTLGAGSEGINLFAADTLVFLQRSYAYGQNIQAEARVHRNGQTRPVTVIDLVSQGTVDELVIEALTSKGEVAEQVLRDQMRSLHEAL